ncbi:uncharacterized protein LY89DRAFT_599883 [Mollisia scopiformis]|uniref:Zn(2)-C6 fungal-type domain-containing protein n=1 Tax=Mollisia scopiformis TaxID=149040 RepID=A0A132B6X4_MOLSC|nr:uncharacterized protein LY89DRAFT_599883 [Mollisia scopiformis]KUJ08162.1 hypothetical protein LY89DRAFT_599883 [Mollisia scopiformis]
MKRISRACLRCRQRKAKCNLGVLGQPGAPPCQSCARDNAECVLVNSRRGGKRVRKSASVGLNELVSTESQGLLSVAEQPSESYAAGFSRPERSFSPEEPITAANIDETIVSTDLHATSEALNMLSQAAQLDSYATPSRSHVSERPSAASPGSHVRSRVDIASQFDQMQYPLVARGLLTTDQVARLVARFKEFYHPYLPIAPRRSFDPDSLQWLAKHEPHLLTAIITVAARDLPQGDTILHTCSSYMSQLVSEIIAGKKCDVEAVEALLLLAEWEPQDSFSEGKEVGCGEEDRAAWMHVGLALRIGYFLGLDRTAIKHEDEDKAAHFSRRRVTWAVCYISDRQLSARIGRAFWSRGPVALAGIGRHGRQTFDDFRPLLPETPDGTDYASVLQANLDLTQLFSNVHDVLYSGMGSSMKMMLAGNYVKYVDDFRRAIEGWKSIWGTLTCPPNIKATLQMSYEYLRLYTNAYAFQATVTRAVAAKSQGHVATNESPHNGVPSLPDARFIYESVDAAKSLLSIITSYIDAENCLRYLPLRFSLYCVNSAVFLYKAWSFNVLSTQEKLGIRHMIKDVTLRLQKASVRPNDFTSRYSELLDRLWQRKDPLPTQNEPQNIAPQTSAGYVPALGGGGGFAQQDEFSWLDLQAVGELVTGSGEQGFGGGGGGGGVEYGFGQFSVPMGGAEWGDFGGMGGEDINRFF